MTRCQLGVGLRVTGEGFRVRAVLGAYQKATGRVRPGSLWHCGAAFIIAPQHPPMPDRHENDIEGVTKWSFLSTHCYPPAASIPIPHLHLYRTCAPALAVSPPWHCQTPLPPPHRQTPLLQMWKCELKMPVAVPTMSDVIDLTLFDEELILAPALALTPGLAFLFSPNRHSRNVYPSASCSPDPLPKHSPISIPTIFLSHQPLP